MIGFVTPFGLPGALPTQQLEFSVAPGVAWAVLLASVALACVVFWFLTRTERPESRGGSAIAGAAAGGISQVGQGKLADLPRVGTHRHDGGRRAA